MSKAKSKRLITEVAKAYVDEITSKFPSAETEIVWEGIDGFDVWIRIELPEDLADQREDILDETVKLNFRFYDDTGVSTIATVISKLPEGAR